MKNLGYKEFLFLFFCGIAAFYGYVRGMEEVSTEIHEQIAGLISGNLDTPEDIIKALQQSVDLLVTNKSFDQFKKLLADAIKQKANPYTIYKAFIIAAEKNYPRIAEVLFLTGKIATPNLLDNLTEDVRRGNTGAMDRLEKVLFGLKNIKNKGYNINPVIEHLRYAFESKNKELLDVILNFAKNDKDLLNAILRINEGLSTPLENLIYGYIFRNLEGQGELYNYISLLLDITSIDNTLVKYLLDTPNEGGYTALTAEAEFHPNGKMVKMLLKHGLQAGSKQLSIKTPAGKTVIDIVDEKIKELKDKPNKSLQDIRKEIEYNRIYKLLHKAMHNQFH